MNTLSANYRWAATSFLALLRSKGFFKALQAGSSAILTAPHEFCLGFVAGAQAAQKSLRNLIHPPQAALASLRLVRWSRRTSIPA